MQTRTFFILFVISLSMVAAQAQSARSETFSFIAFGDMPYTLPSDYARFENLIKAVNEQTQAFTINVGDIKSSSTPCTEEAYNKILDYFQEFTKPLIYVPGDNEWTDCAKKEAGSYDAEERLTVIRKLFFKEKKTFGKEKLQLVSQSQQKPFSKFVENNQWSYGNVAFATIHLVGTNNNFIPTSTNGNKEFYEREVANISWLEEVFQKAKSDKRIAIVLGIHADMYNPEKEAKGASGFTKFKDRLKELVMDFNKPVLLVNGDSHVFLVDKPMYENEKLEKALDNFTRVQVHGENNIHAVKITINPSSISLFQIEELRVPGN
jgi:Calcineurin-like phosphoesterase